MPDWTVTGDGYDAGELTVETVAGSLSGQAAVINNSSATGDRYFIFTWDDVGSNNNVEVLMRFRAPQGFDQYKGGAGAAGRVDTGSALRPGYRALTGYQTFSGSTSGYLTSGNSTNSPGTQIGSGVNIVGNPPPTNTWLWQRLRCYGTDISAWFWEEGDPPKTIADTPDITTTDATYTGGYCGIFWDCADTEFASGVELEVDYFAVGTAGDEAPAYSSGTTAIAAISALRLRLMNN